MSERASEGQLIEACRQGDHEAFRQLFQSYNSRVWSIAVHFTGDRSAASDITQQVFLKLFTSIGQFRHEAGFATWLYRLVVNACLDEGRRRRRFISLDSFRTGEKDRELIQGAGLMKGEHLRQLEAVTQRGIQEEECSQLEISTAVQAAVKDLSPKLRMAILLKYFEGLSYEAMARVLDCSIGTVASRLNRGHKELARRLAHLKL
jgi:RNA polymerase sigma-70 factor, ECF subfamily